MRFPREARILHSPEFQRCQQEGKRFQSRHFVLLRLPNPNLQCRLGLVVTKKTGCAVIRNRWKRVLRDTFRLHREDKGWQGDHVVIVRGSMKGPPPKEIREEMIELFMKAQKR